MMSWRDREVLARLANEFDRELYSLIHEAKNKLVHDFRNDGSVAREWSEIATALETIRPRVRAMMRAADRETTE